MQDNKISRRTLLKTAAIAGAVLPLGRAAAAIAQPEPDGWLAAIHPDLREPIARMSREFGAFPPLNRETLAQSRESMKRWSQPDRPDIPVTRQSVPGGKGQPDVDIYVINAKTDGARPAILHTHGGGFVSGSARLSVKPMQDLAAELDCVVVTVEYRLAPEATWRGSVEDNYAALKWLHANASSLGVDGTRIALLGESAGGGHAALLAIVARDRGEVPVAFQCLIYPMLDDRTGSSRAAAPHLAPTGWKASENRFGWESFLGMAPGGANVPLAAVPARTKSLAGLPPAFIGVGSLDLFVEEDIDYARRLNGAGVPAELIVVPGAVHGFDMMVPDAPVVRRFNAAKIDALRRGLGLARPHTYSPEK